MMKTMKIIKIIKVKRKQKVNQKEIKRNPKYPNQCADYRLYVVFSFVCKE